VAGVMSIAHQNKLLNKAKKIVAGLDINAKRDLVLYLLDSMPNDAESIHVLKYIKCRSAKKFEALFNKLNN
jgi:hypothetical protein